MAGITVLETLEADVPTPATDKDTIFVDPTNGLGYKDDAGAVTYVATGGTVTNTGTLTDHALIVGNGGADVSALASLGTTTTVLHGNAAGDPTFGAVSLTADVSGDLPFANLVQASGASKLVGRGSAAGAGDFQEITLGTNISLSGTTLNVPTGAGGLTRVSRVVTDTEIKSLNSSPITLVTVAANHAAIPWLLYVYTDTSAGAYSASPVLNLQMTAGGSAFLQCPSFLAFADRNFTRKVVPTTDTFDNSTFANTLILQSASDVTGGNGANTLTVVVYYSDETATP